jgi:hypothetical protein
MPSGSAELPPQKTPPDVIDGVGTIERVKGDIETGYLCMLREGKGVEHVTPTARKLNMNVGTVRGVKDGATRGDVREEVPVKAFFLGLEVETIKKAKGFW